MSNQASPSSNQCRQCPRSFRSPVALYKHLKSAHGLGNGLPPITSPRTSVSAPAAAISSRLTGSRLRTPARSTPTTSSTSSSAQQVVQLISFPVTAFFALNGWSGSVNGSSFGALQLVRALWPTTSMTHLSLVWEPAAGASNIASCQLFASVYIGSEREPHDAAELSHRPGAVFTAKRTQKSPLPPGARNLLREDQTSTAHVHVNIQSSPITSTTNLKLMIGTFRVLAHITVSGEMFMPVPTKLVEMVAAFSEEDDFEELGGDPPIWASAASIEVSTGAPGRSGVIPSSP